MTWREAILLLLALELAAYIWVLARKPPRPIYMSVLQSTPYGFIEGSSE